LSANHIINGFNTEGVANRTRLSRDRLVNPLTTQTPTDFPASHVAAAQLSTRARAGVASDDGTGFTTELS
jgi:hypothetical protein